MSLVEAALRDQERRVLESQPRALPSCTSRIVPAATPTISVPEGECVVCRGSLATNNKSGICSRTLACRSANRTAWNKRNPGKYKKGRREYRKRMRALGKCV